MEKRTTKQLTKQDIISSYFDYVLLHNQQPATVYEFAKQNKFKESEFYAFFGNFDAIEQHVFQFLFEDTMKLLQKDKAFIQANAKEKLLSFYYTFFENLTMNRRFVKYALQNESKKMPIRKLALFKTSFVNFIQSLEVEPISIKQENVQSIANKTIEQSAWIQFLFTLKFWLQDGSASFEKTDLFIEKSVNASFDLIDPKPLRSLVDFGKFIWQENPFKSV